MPLWTEEPEPNTPPWWLAASLLATWLFIILSIDEAIHYLFAWLF